MQLGGGKKKRVASFRANKKFSLFFLFPIYQTRLLLPVALADLPPSHTQSKRISRCTVGWHSVVNIFPLEIMPGLQFVIGCIARYSERAFSACVGGLLRRNCQFNTFSSLRANYRQKHQYHCRDYYKTTLSVSWEQGWAPNTNSRQKDGRQEQPRSIHLKRKMLYLYFVPKDCILKLAGEGGPKRSYFRSRTGKWFSWQA